MKQRTSLFVSVVIALVAGSLMTPLYAQQQTGSILGTIRDESGGVIVGADVTAENVATGVTTETVSSDDGFYIFPALGIGEYSVTVMLPGFSQAVQTGVRVVAGSSATVDVVLQVGEVTETFTVSAESPVVEKTDTRTSDAQLAETVEFLPLQVTGSARRSLDFLGTLPGVQYQGTSSASGTIVHGIGDAGPHRNAVTFNIDGQVASLNFSQGLRDDNGPHPDLVQEFRLETNQNAEHGWTLGTGVELITKSGSNKLHGSVFWFHRNDNLDARNFFASSVSPLIQNEFGFVLGGPIVEDRHFFMVSFDGFRRRSNRGGVVRTAATERMRSGDFGEWLGPRIGADVLGRPIFDGAIYDPATTRPDGQGGFIRDPFPNNIIPANRISGVSAFFRDLIPLPTQAGLQNNWVGSGGTAVRDQDRTYLKLDSDFGMHRVTFGWEDSPQISIPNEGVWPEVEGGTNNARNYRLRLNYNVSIQPVLLLSARAGINRAPRVWGTIGTPTADVAAGVIEGALTPDVPSISIAGHTNFGSFVRTVECPQGTVPVAVDLSWVKGRHNTKFGSQFLMQTTRQVLEIFAPGSYNFTDRGTGLPGVPETGVGYATFLLGDSENFTQWTNRAEKHTSFTWAFYAQDSWRATDKLTVNYGLRWELPIPAHETYDRIGTFSPSISNPAAGGINGALWFWGEGPGRNGRKRTANLNYANWGPRLGLAYALDEQTVIRGYAGLMYYPLNGEAASGFITPNLGFGAQVSRNSPDNGVTPAVNWTNGIVGILPAVPSLDPSLLNGSTVNFLDPLETKQGRVTRLGAALERQILGSVLVRAEYTGMLAHGIPSAQIARYNQLPLRFLGLGDLLLQDINSPDAQAAGISSPYAGFTGTVAQALRPFPQYDWVVQNNSKSAYSLYHSGIFSLQKRFETGFSFFIAHTIAKNLTVNDAGTNFNALNPNGAIQHWGLWNTSKMLATFDLPWYTKMNYAYELPFGPGKRWMADASGIVRQLVGGWTVAGIHNYSGGVPIRVTTRQFLQNIGPAWPILVDGGRVRTSTSCGDFDPGDPSRNRYLNINAFATPAQFQLGNTRVLPNVRTCGFSNEDFAILKDFFATEEVNLRFGAEFFNLFNRHHFRRINTDIDNPGAFGTQTNASNPRTIQFHLKITF